MIKPLLFVLSGNAANSLLLLVRNLLIARLISVEDYGIAATFALALAIIEMTSAFGLQQQMVQDKRGDDPDFQAALQGFQVLRGGINMVIMFLLAAPFAAFMGVPEVTWAHQMIVVVLVLNGFVHFDIHRLTRGMRFGPAALAAGLAPLVALLAVWPLYLAFGDYRVMLWSLIIQAAATALMSHLVAERPYRLRFDRAVIQDSLRFGWPLILDGMVLFAIFNGERLIIGNALGMEPLALFSMAMTLTLTPAILLQKSAGNYFLPQLSARAWLPAFQPLAMVTLQAHLFLGGVLVLAVAVAAGPLVHLVLGPKYAPIVPILTLLAIMQGLRIAKGGGVAISMARAHTANGLVANLVRVLTLPVVWYLARTGGNLTEIILIAIAGEALGLLISLVMLRVQLRMSLRAALWPVLVMCAIFATGIMAHLQGWPAWWPVLLVPGLGLALWAMPDLRVWVRQRGRID